MRLLALCLVNALVLSLLFTTTQCNSGCPDGAVRLDSLRNVLLFSAQAYVTLSGVDQEDVDEVGICWNQSGNPEISDNLTPWDKPVVPDNLEIVVQGLSPGQTCYFRAYLRRGKEVCYSEVQSAQTWDGTLRDVDGNQYTGVQIGLQGWMAENLRTTHYADGSPVDIGQASNRLYWYGSGYPYVPTFDTDLDLDGDLDEQDSLLYVARYGPLYSWFAANNYHDPAINPALDGQRVRAGIRDVCPAGWHVPTRLEWQELRLFLEMQHGNDSLATYLMSEQGWRNGGGNNLYGFGLLPGAYWTPYGGSHGNILGAVAFLWLSSDINDANADYVQIDDLDKRLYNSSIGKGIHALCIRCLKDK